MPTVSHDLEYTDVLIKTETSMPATSCLSTYILYFHIMTLSYHT